MAPETWLSCRKTKFSVSIDSGSNSDAASPFLQMKTYETIAASYNE